MDITAVERILKIAGVVVLRIIFHCVGVCRVTSFERKLVEVSLSGGRNCCIWLAHLGPVRSAFGPRHLSNDRATISDSFLFAG